MHYSTGMDTIHPNVGVTREPIAAFCEKWEITQFELFGSVLRDDFGPESDVDVLVSFARDSHWTLLDMVRMEDELADMFGRGVDLVQRSSIERSPNWLRRREILSTARPVYAER